jgi:hypothetical protein
MRTIIFAVLLAACTTSVTGGRVNIPATRQAIQTEIGAERSIVSMGQVTDDKAVVYTQVGKDASTRREEVWVKSGDHWAPNQAPGPTPGVAGEGAPSNTAN